MDERRTDKELQAMQGIAAALELVRDDPAAVTRALKWALSRYRLDVELPRLKPRPERTVKTERGIDGPP